MKIINWIFGSFFRTLGRFLFYIAIGFLVMFILNGKVHAETFDVTTNTTMAGYHFPAWWTIVNNRNLVFKYEDWQYLSQTESIQANFGYLDTCANANFTVNNNNADCGDGCFNNNFNVVNTGRSCTIIYDGSGTTSGRQYLIFYSVKEWGWSNADTLPIVYDTLTFNGNSTIQFYGNYLSNEDLYLEFASTNRLNDLLEQQQALQEETNDKLDTTIDQNDTIIDQNQDIINNQDATNDKLDTTIDQNDTIIDQNDKTNEELGNLNDNLTSTDGANLSALENSAGWLPAGPVDSILNLPLSLLNNITTNLNKSCQPVILPIPYVNKDLTLPCVNTLYDDMGISAWVTTVGVIASAFIMFSYLLKLYRWVDDTLSFRENNQIDNWGGI